MTATSILKVILILEGKLWTKLLEELKESGWKVSFEKIKSYQNRLKVTPAITIVIRQGYFFYNSKFFKLIK